MVFVYFSSLSLFISRGVAVQRSGRSLPAINFLPSSPLYLATSPSSPAANHNADRPRRRRRRQYLGNQLVVILHAELEASSSKRFEGQKDGILTDAVFVWMVYDGARMTNYPAIGNSGGNEEENAVEVRGRGVRRPTRTRTTPREEGTSWGKTTIVIRRRGWR